MERSDSLASANEQLARRINQEARQDPKSPYVGKLVGIAHGQVVVVADSWREVVERLRQVEPDPAKCYCIDASADYERLEEIWRVAQCRWSNGLFKTTVL
jgi:hypothetical protein